jgi:hypothetical protein
MAVKTLFISYRRADTAGWAGRLHADLRARMGPDATIFMDVDGIPPGEDFGRYIDHSVGRCDALIALIGRGWEGRDLQGRRRIDNPRDFVRLEISSALQRGIRVIPVQVEDAKLPSRGELPESLKLLVDRQSIEIDNSSWEPAIDRLVASFDTRVPKLLVTPNRLDFGRVSVNQAWPRRTLHLRNAGGGELRPSASSMQSWILLHHRLDSVDVLIDASHEGELIGEVTIQSAGGSANVEVTASVVGSQVWVPDRRLPPELARPSPNVPPGSPTAPPQPGPAPQPFLRPALPPRPSTHMAAAIITTLLFCGLGVFSIVFAARVNALYAAGDYEGAQKSSRLAMIWAWVAGVIGSIVFFIYFVDALAYA